MIRSAASKVMWVGRATVSLVGLAVILALVVGLASAAFGANGQAWILGQGNVATAITSLGGAAGVNGPMVRLTNNNADANDTALDLRVQSGEAPMRVNSDTRVTNLNADKLDGQEASTFMTANTYDLDTGVGLPASSSTTTQPTCDEGDVAISGGFSDLNADTRLLSSERRDGSPRVWDFSVVNQGTETDNFKTEVVCADFPPLRP